MNKMTIFYNNLHGHYTFPRIRYELRQTAGFGKFHVVEVIANRRSKYHQRRVISNDVSRASAEDMLEEARIGYERYGQRPTYMTRLA
jgi:hypothetical protein